MSIWNRFTSRFAPERQPIVQALVNLMTTRLGIADLQALAAMQPHALANAIAAVVGDNPFTSHDDAERLGFATRLIEVARELLGSEADPSESTKPKPVPVDQSFTVNGQVRSAAMQPLVNHIVRAFDKDLRHEELLGEATTDAQGR